jgi:zinc protease
LRRILAVLALVLAALPARAALFNPETFTLANGLQVVAIEDRRVPVVSHMVWYRVGAADEQPGKSGLAHFLEHLMFKGTEKIAPGEFSKTVARNGGRDNAFTSHDYTAYFQNVARDRLELVMQMEADRMQNLRLTDEVVLPERDVVREERRSTLDNNPRSVLNEQMSAVQFMNHPYGKSIIGWDHEIARLSTQDALDFYRRHYAPNNAVLIVAGDINAAELKPLAEKYYGSIPRREIAPRERPQEPPQLAARRITLEDARARQPSWTRTWLAPSRNAGETQHAVPLTVLVEILNGRIGRLDRQLVQGEGVANSAGAWYDDDAQDRSVFGLSATPRPGQDMAKLEAAIDKLVAELLRDGVTAAEVDRAKTTMKAQSVYARDSAGTAARVIGIGLTTGQTIAQIETWPDAVAAVTPEAVNAAARAVFDLRRSVTGILLPKPQS